MTVIGKTSQFSPFFVVSNSSNKFSCASIVKSSKYISTVVFIENLHEFRNNEACLEIKSSTRTQLINLANQNARGTWPEVVGQMRDLIQEYRGRKLEEWEKWYLSSIPKRLNRLKSCR
jgi:hypothetical protein